MKNLIRKTVVFIIIIGIAIPSAVFAYTKPMPQAPLKKEHEEAAAIASGDFVCFDNFAEQSPLQWKILRFFFIKNPDRQQIQQVCMLVKTAFILREEMYPQKTLVRGGIYNFSEKPEDWYKKYLQRRAFAAKSFCEIQPTSNENRIRYLCYSPEVASNHTGGEEFSFVASTRRVYSRPCTVYFETPLRSECKNWRRKRS